jgi:hypothetical protein
MAIDPIAAKVAEQSVRAAKDHAKAERQKLEDESITIRESGEKFYGNLALFAGGTIALSITYLGYLKSSHNSVVYRKVLIASWVVLLVCAIASLSSVLVGSYYVHFARLRLYTEALKEHDDTMAQEMDNLLIVNVNPEERKIEKQRYTDKAKQRGRDTSWVKKRETISSVTWSILRGLALVSFPVGLGLLMYFAVKNI